MHVKGGKFFSWFFDKFLGIFPEGFLNERIVVNCIDSRVITCNTVVNFGAQQLGNVFNRPNRLRFVLPISTHVTIPLGSLNIVLLFVHMAQLCMARNM